MNYLDELCKYCFHPDEDHDRGPDQRTPRAVRRGEYVCTDCVSCELRRTDG